MNRWRASRRSSSRSSRHRSPTSKAWRSCSSSSTWKSPWPSPRKRSASSAGASPTADLRASWRRTIRCLSAISACAPRLAEMRQNRVVGEERRLPLPASRGFSLSRPGEHAVFPIAVGAPAEHAALARCGLEGQLALALRPDCVLFLDIAIRQSLAVGLLEAIERGIEVAVVNALPYLALHDLAKVIVLWRRRARQE